MKGSHNKTQRIKKFLLIQQNKSGGQREKGQHVQGEHHQS